MNEFFDAHPDFSVHESEYKRLLGYPVHHALDGRARELADATRQWCAESTKPWVYVREAAGFEIANGKLQIGGTEFVSARLHDQLRTAQAHDVMLAAVSAGGQCEERARQLWQEGKPDEYFFMEIYGSAMVEHLITTTGARLCAWAEQKGMAVLPHYSPGYSGWDVSEQNKLLELIRPGKGHVLPGELSALDSGMLRPKKSLLAVFGITRHLDKMHGLAGLIPCQNCSFSPCQYRRAPYKYFLPQFEDVSRLQSGGDERPDAQFINASSLTRNAPYSVNLRALRKWSQERLQLKTLHDGSLEARFRYEGTTCSNLGRPLEYDYHVILGPPDENYKIVDAVCVPAPGDTGHASQCEYLNDATLLMRRIAGEKPLLGRPLDDVLAWRRPYSPSGCYCDAEQRAHKWGLVLEVIHFALVQREREATDAKPAAILQQT